MNMLGVSALASALLSTFSVGSAANVVNVDDSVVSDTYFLSGVFEVSVDGGSYAGTLALARTPGRVLLVVATPEEPNQRFYLYADSAMPFPVSFDVENARGWSTAADLDDVEGLTIDNLLQQKKAEGAPLAGAVQKGPQYSASLAIFFGDPSALHTIELANSVIRSGEPHVNEFGTLSITRQGDGSVLSHHRSESDLLDDFAQKLPLKELASKEFPQGISSKTSTCTFSVPLEQLSSTPWEAQIETITHGIGGETFKEQCHVTVSEFDDDPDRVNVLIDAFVAKIPDGTQVIVSASDNLSYKWSDGSVVIAQDKEALAATDGLAFTPPESAWTGAFWPATIALFSLMAAAWFSWSRRT